MNDWWAQIDQDSAWQQMNENEYRRHQEEIDYDEEMHKQPLSLDILKEWLKEKLGDWSN